MLISCRSVDSDLLTDFQYSCYHSKSFWAFYEKIGQTSGVIVPNSRFCYHENSMTDNGKYIEQALVLEVAFIAYFITFVS